jgi:Protein of unknown function (DUF938)
MAKQSPKQSLWPDWQQSDDGRQRAPAAERNKDFILEVLKTHLPKAGTVLEIASGTGEQAIYFTRQLSPLCWLPSDYDQDRLKSIAAWRAHSPTENLLAPVQIDTSTNPWSIEGNPPTPAITAIVCINMIHIAPFSACEGLLAGAGRILPSGGVLYFYGPFMRGGKHTAPSNAEFDARLKERDASWGLRDIDVVADLASGHALSLGETIAMPANNFSLIFEKT